MINKSFKRVVVIAPHPDDETLGLGGSIARFKKSKIDVSVLIISGHLPPLYKSNSFEKTKFEAEKVFKLFGINDYQFLEIPATKVNEVPTAELNKKINKFIIKRKPDTVFIPFPDRHVDHRVIFDSAIVSCRPISRDFPKNVFLYETLSETHWNVPNVEPNFQPDFFINIDKTIDLKLKALKYYKSQINEKTNSRSVESAKALARFRGSQNGCKYAEAFKVVRIVI